MRLKKLEIYGFKSFAQRTEIVFDQGITGIVGPNGSGKSNIGDAVRWVLGEQSAKTLRGARMEDVIFGGTQKRKAMTYCEVSLVFDNEDHTLPVDYAEVMVTRRVFRNGDSEYYLNKTACRLKDVVTLFRDTGIGKEGYSIVGQGRIDEILSQKGEDRRKVFEEAAGIVNFKSRKEEAQTRLGRTMDNLSRVEDIIEELSMRVGPLEKQADTARQYLKLSEELKELELNIFLVRHDRIKERVAELDQTLSNLDAVLQQAELQSAEKNAARGALEAHLKQLEENLLALRHALSEANDAYHEEKSRAQRYELEKNNREENLERLLNERQEDEKRAAALKEMGEEQSGGMNRQDALLKEMKEALSDQETQLKNAALLAQEKEQALESHKAAVIEAMNRVSNLKAIEQRQTAVRAQMQSREKELEKSAGELAQSLHALQKDFEDTSAQMQSVQTRFKGLEAQARAMDDKARTLGAEVTQATGLMQKAMQEGKAMESRLHALEEMAKGYEGYYNAVRAALTHAKKTGKTGVRDVVAMLLSVPRELETAIDMVLGAALQNIVTEDEKAAKELIDYLRQNRLGRATFLPMNTIRGKVLSQEERRVLLMKGCLGVASERVGYAPEYRQIVENLLGRTVIAENLDAGIEIMRAGRHAFRLVTLDGDVMHSGGSMTGGSVQQKAGNFLSREREIKELREAITQKALEVQALEQSLAALEEERKKVKLSRQEAMYQMHQEEIAVAREQERVQAARAQLDGVQARIDATSQAREQIQDSIRGIDEDLKRIASQQDTGESGSQRMQEETETLRLAFQAARETQEALREKLTARLLEYTKMEHETAALYKDRQRLKAETQALLQKLEKTGAAIAQLKAEMARAENAQAQSEDKTRTLLSQVQAAEEMVEKTEAARQSKQEALNTLHKDIEQLHLETAADSDRRHQTELQKARQEAELTAMQERIWNTYELTYAGAQAFRREEKFDLGPGEKRAQELRSGIRALGPVNVGAIEEYADAKARYDELTAQKDDLLTAKGDLEELIARLEKQMEKQFVSQFALLQGYFKETFVRLFGGGQAELKLEDPNDALNCGIEIIAQPPGKKLQLLSLLSGGERALCAIAILFAMLKLKATPFCILDEIEAALDEANIGYFADYLVEYSQKTQFVVVTHRKGTMEHCDALYGVAMEEQGVSKMVSVNLTDYDA